MDNVLVIRLLRPLSLKSLSLEDYSNPSARLFGYG